MSLPHTMKTLSTLSRRFDACVTLILKWACILLFVALSLVLSGNILQRILPFMSMQWFDEVVELMFAALVFYGAAALWVTHGHFSVGDWISQRIHNTRARHAYRLLVEVLSLCFMLVFLFNAYDIVIRAQEITNNLMLPKSMLYACMPVAAAIMSLYSLRNVCVELALLLNPRWADDTA